MYVENILVFIVALLLTQIAQTYAFLPREAVTRYLMSCTDCQKRMYLSLDVDRKPSMRPAHSTPTTQCHDVSVTFDATDVNYNVPLTTSYLNQLKQLQKKQVRIVTKIRNLKSI